MTRGRVSDGATTTNLQTVVGAVIVVLQINFGEGDLDVLAW